jgi:AraC-like DNA-binding protein
MVESGIGFLILVSSLCILGFIVFLILAFYNSNKTFSAKLLAGILFSLSYTLLAYLLYISKAILDYPHLYRTPAFISLCIAPLLFIYVRSSLNQSFWFKKWDFLYFLPAVLYTAQFIPFYILPAQDKLYFIERAIQSKAYGVREPEGLLPPGFGFSFRMIYSLALIGSAFFMLIKWYRRGKTNMLALQQNLEIYKWLFYLTVVLSSTFLILVINFVFQLNGLFDKYKISTLTLTFAILFITIYLFFKPSILYGFQGWYSDNTAIAPILEELPNESDHEIEERKKQFISETQGAAYKEMIESHFEANQPFLKPKYTLRHLSEEIKVPAYLISAFINQEYGKNFSEFINDKRVDYLIELAIKEPEHLQQYTLEVLGQMSGFHSRSSFISAVKRKTGKNPSEIFAK